MMDADAVLEILTGLSVLNVARGDAKLTFNKEKPEELQRAKTIVADMLRRGYAIFVRVGEREGNPLYQRIERFDPETAEYEIVGVPEESLAAAPARRGKLTRTRMKADRTHAVAIAPSAGG